ncbi:MAG TPA: Rieske 2Fe-2S domain-containing protein, partial [Beijerinckiaceae bacterium]|nr:Rieske 2Fe-2S domain-containing protein [Beijerinckiaceae bacterium]
MLSHEQNERLVRVGRGQPAGEMFRRYWQPALLSEELKEPDGAPVRVRLLGEDLVAFRDTTGRVGLVDAFCPHRRAPLFFGRNEECGIRCVYHGWKFDADGACVDTPSEPSDSGLKSRIQITAYPTFERGGVVWAYLGPREGMPAPPDFEWMRAPATHRDVTKTLENCNYLQGLEGGLDTTHGSFLHYNAIGNKSLIRQRDRAPKIEVETTDYGYTYASLRGMPDDRQYVRVYHYVLPNHQIRANLTAPGGDRRYDVPMIEGHTWVPIDDEHTWVYNWACGYDGSVELTPEHNEAWNSRNGRGKDDFIPGTYELRQCKANDYLIDRAAQKTQTFTGIKGVNTQDWAVQEGMGPIVDRS